MFRALKGAPTVRTLAHASMLLGHDPTSLAGRRWRVRGVVGSNNNHVVFHVGDSKRVRVSVEKERWRTVPPTSEMHVPTRVGVQMWRLFALADWGG